MHRLTIVLAAAFPGAGYRHLAIDATDDSAFIDVDLTFSGPFAVAGLGW